MTNTQSSPSDQTPPPLYNIPPRCVGAPNVESLSSFFNNLAKLHHVTPYTLAFEIVLPFLQMHSKVGQFSKPDRLTGTWWAANAVTINSANPMTALWIFALSTLTDNADLHALTLYSFQHVLPYRNLIRQFTAWCPECFGEDQLAGAYSRLLWQVECITVCPKHLRPLAVQCPCCSKKFPSTGHSHIEGFCPHCSIWLGRSSLYEAISIGQTEMEDQIHTCKAVSEMLSASPTLSSELHTETIGLLVTRAIREFFDGNAKALADRLGMHHRSIYEIRDSTQLPRLQTLLRICRLLNTSPLRVFTANDVQQLPISLGDVSYSRGQKKSYRKLDRNRIKTFLLSKLASNEPPPPSLAEVAAEINYDPSYLSDRFPEECSQISARLSSYEARQATQLLDKQCSDVRQLVYELHSVGIYPSHKAIRRGLGGILLNPIVRKVYRDTLRELEYID